ncbi:MAG: hypothetical protein V1739_06990 [Candidatus Omnitrophota bacterium]
MKNLKQSKKIMYIRCYKKSGISAEFENLYSDKDVLMNISAGKTMYLKLQNDQVNVNSTNNINNTNIEQDIIKRQIQSTLS